MRPDDSESVARNWEANAFSLRTANRGCLQSKHRAHRERQGSQFGGHDQKRRKFGDIGTLSALRSAISLLGPVLRGVVMLCPEPTHRPSRPWGRESIQRMAWMHTVRRECLAGITIGTGRQGR